MPAPPPCITVRRKIHDAASHLYLSKLIMSDSGEDDLETFALLATYP